MARYIQLCLVSSLLWGLAPAAPPREGKPEILTTHNVFSLRRSFVHRPKVFVDHRHWKYKCAQHDGGGGRSSHQGTDTPAKSDSKPSKDSKDSTAAGISGSPVTSVNQVEYITGVVADGNRYNLIVDTGSSDTFIVNNGFVCLDEKKQKVAEQVCKFGPPFKGPFSGGTVPNTHFSITYGNGGSGPALHGTFGYSR